MRFKSFQIGKSSDKRDKDAEKENEFLVTKISDMEEQVNGKTRKLEETELDLKNLRTVAAFDGNDVKVRPHGPLAELNIEPEEYEEKEDMSDIMEKDETDEEIPVVEVIKAEKEATAPATEKKNTGETKEAPGADDSLASLFSQDDEEVNPLESLIDSLPDVTPQELMDDLQEIQGIIRELHH